jgi:glycosyltransferase involved in cell wall biosynthesis
MNCGVMNTPETSRSARTDAVGVLFIIDQLCEMGGAERVLLRMIRQLPRSSYSPIVVTFKIDESLGIANSISCPLYVYPLRRTYDRTAFRVARQIRHLVRSQKIRITHTFHETSDLWGGMIAKMSGCPILISSRRDMGFLRESKHRLGYRYLGRYFNQVQTVSEEVRRYCIEQDGLDHERVVSIHNGVDFPPAPEGEDQRTLRARFGLEKATHLVVSLGHVRKIKGYDVLLRAAAYVRDVMPGVLFAIAGENHEPAHFSELMALLAALRLESNVTFLGQVDDIGSLLRASDVFCLPSRTEGLSNALLEAMACERPCVATRVGGNPEVLVDGKTGYLVESEDAESLAARILQLLQHPATARTMGFEGRRVMEEQFTTQAMMKRLINSYERLLISSR